MLDPPDRPRDGGYQPRSGPWSVPSPGTCGCTNPKYLDSVAQIWIHLNDNSPCVPRNASTGEKAAAYDDAAPRAASWPSARP